MCDNDRVTQSAPHVAPTEQQRFWVLQYQVQSELRGQLCWLGCRLVRAPHLWRLPIETKAHRQLVNGQVMEGPILHQQQQQQRRTKLIDSATHRVA